MFCNVITIVEAAVKTTKALKDLYDLSTGFSNMHQRLRNESKFLEAIAEDLVKSQDKLALSPHQERLTGLTKECANVSKQIQLILEKCQVDSRLPRPIAVARAWLKSETRKSEIESLNAGLESCERRLWAAMMSAARWVFSPD
jgi:N-terminal domain on NACHT_NTPase and P-loop NTPases